MISYPISIVHSQEFCEHTCAHDQNTTPVCWLNKCHLPRIAGASMNSISSHPCQFALTSNFSKKKFIAFQSEAELAAALDSALIHCTGTQPVTPPQLAPNHNISPTKPCAFYFGSPPGSIGAGESIGQPDLRSPPGSPLEENPDRILELHDPRNSWSSPSASSLHFWINQWLCKQEFENP